MYSENMKNSIQCKYLTYEQFSLNQYYNVQRHTLLILLHTNWVEFLSFIANYTNFDKFSTMFFFYFLLINGQITQKLKQQEFSFLPMTHTLII